jgi:3-hydroxybutyryl-CoA dehydratase
MIYFEDIAEGHEFVSVRRTVTEADVMNFAGISGDFDKLHTDDIFIREETPFTGRIAHGLLVTAIQSGLRCEATDWQTIGYLGFDRRLQAAVYPGSTLHARYRILSTRPSRSRAGAGVVTMRCEVVDQDDVVVQSGNDAYLLLRRDGRDG